MNTPIRTPVPVEQSAGEARPSPEKGTDPEPSLPLQQELRNLDRVECRALADLISDAPEGETV